MYAVYHGPQGLNRIANKVHGFTQVFANTVVGVGYTLVNESFFDTVTIDVSPVLASAELVHLGATEASINLRRIDERHVGVTFDESVTAQELVSLINVFTSAVAASPISLSDLVEPDTTSMPVSLKRTTSFLSHPIFNKHHSETEILRYIHHLASKDLSLAHTMIPLGSCTMKLNSTSSMIPLSWPEFGNIHPFAPHDQVKGYRTIIEVIYPAFICLSNNSDLCGFQELESHLCKITGFHSASLQPNSGAAGEYAGLCVIRAYHESRGEKHRDVCLIPLSAHGTNPAVRHSRENMVMLVLISFQLVCCHGWSQGCCCQGSS